MGSNTPNHRTRGPTPPDSLSACNRSAEWDLASSHHHTPIMAYVEVNLDWMCEMGLDISPGSSIGPKVTVRTRMWTLVGARARLEIARLGIVPPFMGRVTDTCEKESPLITLRLEGRGQISYPGSRGMEHLVVVKALVCAESESPCPGVHVTCGPISRTPYWYSSLLGLHVLLFTAWIKLRSARTF
ncbi:hypothetical protein CRG98_010710 [Punica granatum]|uniref:Uncharacterized protein n=1 Tax=Punica granatum TaxID=22663 RepID=A0A2I0KK08_PUNGR|nr:hypothetical protein CRG98_010710 [Punica granatum]